MWVGGLFAMEMLMPAEQITGAAVLIRQFGAALWGRRWQEGMSEALGDVDTRTLRRWATGDRIPPDEVVVQLGELAAQRCSELEILMAAAAEYLAGRTAAQRNIQSGRNG
jgi:hypothetical protein